MKRWRCPYCRDEMHPKFRPMHLRIEWRVFRPLAKRRWSSL